MLLVFSTTVYADETWQAALSRMPLRTTVAQLNRTNCVGLMLDSFSSNSTVKALVFMPGATDEFYMFRRAIANLTKDHLSLLDAVVALTNQTLIRVTFLPPLLLLHSDEDPLQPLITIEYPAGADKLRARHFQGVFNDRDWNFVQPLLRKALKAEILPWQYNYDSWHFYRHSFACWNLNGIEALQVSALAGKTTVTLKRNHFLQIHPILLVFEGDERVRSVPKFDVFPR